MRAKGTRRFAFEIEHRDNGLGFRVAGDVG